MNTKELNEYIKNYLENDKTQRAIMLTAPWGSGKSYYINNELCDFLHENNLDYAVVSLYGIKDLGELNKELYLEIKFPKTHKKFRKLKAFGNTIAGLGKTILKHVVKIDIDVDLREPDYEKLYNSVNLKNKLIIFEDLERASIDIVEFLGYVNNLVEQDGVKVLLVANEDEILKYEPKTTKEDSSKVLTAKSQEYKKIKEKTICDTIKFFADYDSTINSILNKFDNKYFIKMLEEKDENGNFSLVKDIMDVMNSKNCFNYRSLLSACQKTEDVLNLLNKNKTYKIDFLENLLIETLEYVIKRDNQKDITKTDAFDKIIDSFDIFHSCRFMITFINYHIFIIEDFEKDYELYLYNQQKFNANQNLQVLYNFHTKTEKEVKNSIDIICEKIEKNEGIDSKSYLTIANWLIAIKHVIKYDNKIQECLNCMLNKVKISNLEEIQYGVYNGIELLSQEEADEFNKFKSDMLEIVNNRKNKLQNFDYKPESLSNYYDWITSNKITFINEKGFANKLDVEQTVEMLKKSSAKQIEDFRAILQYIYMGISNIAEFLYDDVKNLIELKLKLDSIVGKLDKIDAIQNLQLKWLSENLGDIIEKLQGGQKCQN